MEGLLNELHPATLSTIPATFRLSWPIPHEVVAKTAFPPQSPMKLLQKQEKWFRNAIVVTTVWQERRSRHREVGRFMRNLSFLGRKIIKKFPIFRLLSRNSYSLINLNCTNSSFADSTRPLSRPHHIHEGKKSQKNNSHVFVHTRSGF